MVRGKVAGSLACFAALAILAAPASGGFLGEENGLGYVAETTSAPPGGATVVQANCPPGSKLFGGGADSVTAQYAGLLNTAAPTDGGDPKQRPDDAYVAFAYNSTGTTGLTSAYAICGPAGSRVRQENAKLPLGTTRAARALCPDGRRVVGGGAWVTGPATSAQLNATRPIDTGDRDRKLDDGWLARATNVGPDRLEVRALAVCRPNLAPTYPGALVDFPAGNGSVGGSCPGTPHPTTSVSGAGGEVRGPGNTIRISAVYPADSGSEAGLVPDDQIWIEAQNLSGSTGRYSAFGACLALAP